MAREYRSILWQTLRIRVGNLRIRGVALHRHLPETTTLGVHRHGFHQLLAYLAGHGTQQIRKHGHAVEAGSLVLLPAGTPHAFRRERSRPPTCLVVEFDLPNLKPRSPVVKHLAALELGKLRTLLSRLARLPAETSPAGELSRAAVVIDLVRTLLASLQPPASANPHGISPLAHKVRGLLQSGTSDNLSIEQIAAAAGHQPDYLGRVIKAETGLTLGQWRARERVERAKTALLTLPTVGEAGARIGFPDQNYFARWFREQTGSTPSAWKRKGGGEIS